MDELLIIGLVHHKKSLSNALNQLYKLKPLVLKVDQLLDSCVKKQSPSICTEYNNAPSITDNTLNTTITNVSIQLRNGLFSTKNHPK